MRPFSLPLSANWEAVRIEFVNHTPSFFGHVDKNGIQMMTCEHLFHLYLYCGATQSVGRKTTPHPSLSSDTHTHTFIHPLLLSPLRFLVVFPRPDSQPDKDTNVPVRTEGICGQNDECRCHAIFAHCRIFVVHCVPGNSGVYSVRSCSQLCLCVLLRSVGFPVAVELSRCPWILPNVSFWGGGGCWCSMIQPAAPALSAIPPPPPPVRRTPFPPCRPQSTTALSRPTTPTPPWGPSS